MRKRLAALVITLVAAPVCARAQYAPPQGQADPDARSASAGPGGSPAPEARTPGPALRWPEAPPAPPGERGAFDPDAEVGYADPGAELAAENDQPLPVPPDYVDDGYDEQAYADFEGALSPYGDWSDDPDYGEVWTPSSSVVGDDFSPYGNAGHFTLTEYGWTWVSDWDWGWAPFHYGRWVTRPGRGWSWVPGRLWGPAWVSWRFGGGRVGWAPLGPRGTTAPAPAPGVRSAWRFTTTTGLSDATPRYVSASGAWQATSPIHNVQKIDRYRVEAGPAPHLIATSSGRTLQPTSVHGLTAAAPRSTITPRVSPGAAAFVRGPIRADGSAHRTAPSGTPAIAPPGMAAHPSTTLGSHGTWSGPLYRTPAVGEPRTWSGPVVRSPSEPPPSYSPTVVGGGRAYAPVAPSYEAPRYTEPAREEPQYAAPVYTPHATTPSYSPHAGGGAPAPFHHAPPPRRR